MLSLSIFITMAIGLLAFLKWYVKKEIYDPMFLVTAYWIIFILFSILLSMKMNLLFYWTGIIPIALLCLSFVIGSLIIKQVLQSETLRKKKVSHDKIISPLRLKWLILGFSVIGLIAIYLQLDFLDIQITNFSDILYAANRISVIRYHGGQDVTKTGLVLMAFLYSAGFLGGVYSVVSRGILNKIISLLPFTVMLLFTVINGVKTGFLFMVIIWISGFIATFVYEKQGEVKKLTRLLLRTCIIILLVMILIPLTQMLRGGNNANKMKLVNAGALSYFCSFNAFSIWYHSYNHDELTGVKYSLSGMHNYFFGEREMGLYGEQNVDVGKFDNTSIITNVYTMTRGLIQDFSLFGAAGVLFLSGIIMQFVYNFTKRRKTLALGILALFYSIVLWSFTVNILNYNTLVLSWVISLVVILFVKKKNLIDNTTVKE